MPELPEVETIVREIRPELLGRRVLSARLSHDDVLRGVSRRKLLRGLAGATIQEVTRRAKHAVIRVGPAAPLDRQPSTVHRLVVQPGMTGSLQVCAGKLDADQRRYAVLRAALDDGRELVYRDVRRLGTLLWLDDAGWREYSAAIGPEPLDPYFTPDVLAGILRRSRAAVKKVLMDQRALAGVGNIYAQEALFAARIDPSKAASRVPAEKIPPLHAALVRILRASIARQGTTVRDYRTGTGQSGNFQYQLKVYDRAGEPCVRCGTTLTGTHAIDARITVFCHRCQT